MATQARIAAALRRKLDVEELPSVLPARRQGSAPLLNPRRLEIVLAAAVYPGVHLRSASRLLLSPLASLRHHVAVLRREGLVAVREESGTSHLFVPNMYTPRAEGFLAALQDPSARLVLHAVEATPGRTESELAAASALQPGIVRRLLGRLERADIVRGRAARGSVGYRTTAAWRRFAESCSVDAPQRVDRFLRLLEREGLHPEAEWLGPMTVRLEVDAARGRIRFVLPVNPLG